MSSITAEDAGTAYVFQPFRIYLPGAQGTHQMACHVQSDGVALAPLLFHN